MVVRETIDDSLFEELPAVIKEYHDGELSPPAVDGLRMPESARCKWPPALLSSISLIAAKCCRTQGKLRATIGVVLPELEQLVPDSQTHTPVSSRAAFRT